MAKAVKKETLHGGCQVELPHLNGRNQGQFTAPPELTKAQMSFVYAYEADMLNVVLFGKTAKEWRAEYPKSRATCVMRRHCNSFLFWRTMRA